MEYEDRHLKAAFLAGAITDAAALVPMLSPWAARVFWGVKDPDDKYVFAMRMGASLMAGWTGLLLWAYRRPLERRFVALLTLQVIAGIVLAEVSAVKHGLFERRKVVPSYIMQALLSTLFAYGYINSRSKSA